MFANVYLDQHILNSVVLCFLIIRPVLSYTRSTSWLTLVLLPHVFLIILSELATPILMFGKIKRKKSFLGT